MAGKLNNGVGIRADSVLVVEYEWEMGQVIVGPWNKLELLKELLERETKRLQELIEQHRALRMRQLSRIG